MSGIEILGNAVSGLKASQVAIRTTSSNITNVNNPDYARRETEFQTRSFGGVDISEIRRIANSFLERESYKAASSAKEAEIVAKLHDRLQSVFGDPSSDGSIAAKMDLMFESIANLQLDPASSVRRLSAINGIQLALDEFGKLAGSIQQIREDADRDVFSRIGVVNDLLKNIHDLNKQIVSATVQNADANALIDQRQKALNQLSGIIDIRLSPQADGQVHVSTSDGTFLVSVNRKELKYDAGSAVGPDTIFPRITLHDVNLYTGAVSPTGSPFESHIQSGELRGLLQMRDVTLPDIAEEVGELAAKLADILNAVHNDSSAVPPPNQLVGRNTGLLGSDAHGFSGLSNFSIVDASGKTVVTVEADFGANQYRVNGGAPVAFAGATIADAVAAINTGLGANGSLTFTNGVMTLSAANPAHGVAMVQDAANPSGRAGRGFAHFFGMNDLVSANAPAHYQTGLTAASAHGFTLGSTVQLKVIDPAGRVVRDFTMTVAGTTIGDLITQLNAGLGPQVSFSLDAQGALKQTLAPGSENSTLFSVSDTTDRGGTGLGFSSLFGIGPGARQLPATGMAVRSDIATNNSRLALAKLDVTAPGVSALGVSDNRGALALYQLDGKVVNFDSAGNIPGFSATLSDYSGQLLSNAARLAAQSENVRLDRSSVYDEITSQINDVSGVNLDEELANLILFQNAYNASARMIKAAQEIFNILLEAV
jgi:flagellar hook-associated protein 1